jgi:hypothetical protein
MTTVRDANATNVFEDMKRSPTEGNECRGRLAQERET